MLDRVTKRWLAAGLLAGGLLVASTADAQRDLLRGKSPEAVLEKYEEVVVGSGAVGAGLGDVAPEIHASEWLKGDEVTEFEPGKVYLVDFWATWCGPCIAAMPKLTELQKKHEKDGLVVIAVNIFENESGQQRIDKVSGFVQKRSDMEYTVAVDSGKTEQVWMRKEGRNSIPTAVLVDKIGRIAWVGNGHDPAMVTTLDELLAESDPQLDDADNETRAWLSGFVRLARDGKAKTSVEVGAALAKTRFKDEPSALSSMAWTVVNLARPTRAQRVLAQQSAERAVELTEEKDAGFLSVLAHVHLINRNRSAAIRYQEQSIAVSSDADEKAELEKALAEMKG